MYQKVRPLFLLCETPLHAGSGSDLGVVDLPIQRERHTSYPKIESSSLKGALREDFESNRNEINIQGKKFKVNENAPKRSKAKGVGIGFPLTLAFGPEGDEADKAHAGALGFTDARILLFPVKSMRGVFAWITCPAVLRRFERDMRLVEGLSEFQISGIPSSSDLSGNNGNFAGHFTNCTAAIPNADAVILEEYTFNLATSHLDSVKVKLDDNGGEEQLLGHYLSDALAINDDFLREKLKTDILIISDDDFRDFVEMSTEVITRTKIDNETGTVQKGGLFTEEYLPTDSLMYALVMSAPVFQPEDKKKNCLLKSEEDVMNYFEQGLREVIQLGANATLGKGILRTRLLNGQKNGKNEQ